MIRTGAGTGIRLRKDTKDHTCIFLGYLNVYFSRKRYDWDHLTKTQRFS